NIKIEIPIVVNVPESCADAPARVCDTRFGGDLLKLAVPEIVKQVVGTVTGNINILPAVIIVIGRRHTHSPAPGLDSGSLGDVLEMAMPISPETSANDIATLLKPC